LNEANHILQVYAKRFDHFHCCAEDTGIMLGLGWTVFWAGVAGMQSAIWCWVCDVAIDQPVCSPGMSCCVFWWPAALLVQCFSWYVVYWR